VKRNLILNLPALRARGARVRDNSQVELSTLPTPSDTDSYKFEMNQIDGSEPLREILTFRRNVEKLRIGVLNADADAPAIIGIVQRMLHATALFL
jgi:hypothetical protein